MATYFHGNSEIQGADGLQTLVLMNPSYVQYSDAAAAAAASQPGNFMFLNSNQASLPHAPPVQTQQFVGFPLASHQDPNPQSMQAQAQAQAHHEISAGMHGFGPRVQYNLWTSIDPNAASAARDTPRTQQGLSLSLSSQQPGFGSQSQSQATGEDMRIAGSSPSSASGVTNGMQSVLMSSKYLKAAQELLDEVVNVGNYGIKVDPSKKNGNKSAGESSAATAAGSGDATEASGKSAADLSTVERQEIQMKKAKLISMLDEVEQRYRQYHHQMQIVTSSFEQVAGIGSAKAYTSLALETISKQFRCLKDAITGQIRGANKSLGEEDCVGGKIEGSRLKFVDHHLRQQRALQQLGMVQHNAWRPQRGLPERSVSVLRAWLFEHFLHPYPKDSDKHMLAKQAGLTRSQVSNWFINARVRLWKPMVEEMYMEELKEQEQNGSEDKTMSKGGETNKEDSASMSQSKSPKRLIMNSNQDNSITNHDTPSMATTPSSASPMVAPNVRNQSVFTLIGASELEEITQSSPKKPRSIDMLQSPTSNGASQNNNNMISMKFGGNERQARDHEYSQSANFIGGFGQYPIGEIGRFDAEQQQQQYTPRFSGNGVSLTLGLPHCENLSLSGTHQSFLQSQNMNQLGRRVDHLGEPNEFDHVMGASTPHSSSAYDSINIQNRKSFAAQLLPDFVA